MNRPFFFDEGEIIPRRLKGKKSRSYQPTQKGCGDCGLAKGCNSPKMEPYGKGRLDIVVVGEQPGEKEDEKGRAFVGPSGNEERSILNEFAVDMDEDCIATNAIQCFSKDKPETSVRLTCLPRLQAQILDAKPRLILCLGSEASSSVLGESVKISKVRGRVMVSRKYSCWVMCTYHPAYIIRQEKEQDREDARRIAEWDTMLGLDYLDCNVSSRLLDENRGNHWITDEADAIELFNRMAESDSPVCFDYETNQLSPFKGNPKIILIGLANCAEEGWSVKVPSKMLWGFKEAFVAFLRSKVPKIAQNAAFEINWSDSIFGVLPENIVSDTMVREHVVDERRKTKGLGWMAFSYFGSTYKEKFGSRKNMVADMSSGRYNSLDCRYPWALTRIQIGELNTFTMRGDALFRRAIPVLASMTRKGIRVHPGRLEALRDRARVSIRESEKRLMLMPAVLDTENATGRMFSFSEKDLRTLFYKVLGLPKVRRTKKTEQASIGIDALLEAVDEADDEEARPYVQCLSDRSEWSKLLSTYVEPFLALRDEEDLIHPSIMLHIARSFRSSSEEPNIQNVPHHGQFANDVRRCIIPKLDTFAEADYSGMEVRIIASVSGDTNLLQDLWDGVDLHRFWASQIYEIPEDEVDKVQRFDTKNGFVFPLFYGMDWQGTMAAPLSLKQSRARSLSRRFWKRYDGVQRWQQKKREEYKKNGWISLISGFRRHAPLTPRMIGNTPVQGPAFHVLLENLITLYEEMRRRTYLSHMVAEAHDSVLLDLKDTEIEDVIALATDTLKTSPSWLPNEVPLEVEWSIGADWGSMEEL